MKKIVGFLLLGTVITLLLIVVCSTACAAVIILLAKLINTRILAALPFSFIAGMVFSFLLYGKIIKIVMKKCGLDSNKKK
ncbi:MAG: hypothetical protein P1P65_06905 [Treponema sp.]